MKQEFITFKLTENDDMILLSFSDGNTIIADIDGISTYNTNKTVHFKSIDVKVNSTFIESVDEDGVVVWIMPETQKKEFGLSNDIVVNQKKIRTYKIREIHFDKIKNLLWDLSLKKFNDE